MSNLEWKSMLACPQRGHIDQAYVCFLVLHELFAQVGAFQLPEIGEKDIYKKKKKLVHTETRNREKKNSVYLPIVLY